MKSYKLLSLLVGMMLTFGSCSDYLDQMPEEQLSEAALFKSKDDVVRVLTQIYAYHPQPSGFQGYIGVAADDVDFNWSNYNPYYKDVGQYSSS